MKKSIIDSKSGNIYCIGAGIASLSAAFFLIRDAGYEGNKITIFEELDHNGGCLDATSSSKKVSIPDYISRGGRMFEEHYVCMFDMLKDIPLSSKETTSVKDDIFNFNKKVVSDAECRLLKNGLKKTDVSSYGLSFIHLLYMGRLLLFGKNKTNKKIEDYFPSSFFKTPFWLLWTTSFSFQKWSNVDELRRYFLRFIHLLPGFNKFKNILRTRYNQYDSIIVPLHNWLKEHGVIFKNNISALSYDFDQNNSSKITSIHLQQKSRYNSVSISDNDIIFISPGSMVERSTQGSMKKAAPVPDNLPGPSWKMWQDLAHKNQNLKSPDFFIKNIAETEWLSFTVTQTKPDFFQFMEQFTTDETGTGGLVSFVDSNWFFSIVMFHQPFFQKQKKNTFVFWGYGLYPEKKGNYVYKPMFECSGEEILREVYSHLEFSDKKIDEIISYSNAIPVRMPYITSQFQPRPKKSRPEIKINNKCNYALLGQFVEQKDDVVFTVEYSVRTAMNAVYSFFDTGKKVPGVYKGQYNPIVLLKALIALLR